MQLLYLTLVVELAVGVSATRAQTSGKASPSDPSMTGVVKAVSAFLLTIERRDAAEVVFSVDSSTRLVRRGPAPGSRNQSYPNGANDLVLRDPPKIADLLKRGERVRVRFQQSGSALRAVEVRVIPTP